MVESSDDIRALTRIPGVGVRTAEKLISQKGITSIEDLLKLSVEELTEVEGIGEVKAKKIMEGAHRLWDSRSTTPEKKDSIVRHFVETKRWREDRGIEDKDLSVKRHLYANSDNIVRTFVRVRREKSSYSFSTEGKRVGSFGSEDVTKSRRKHEGFTNGTVKKKVAAKKSHEGMINGFRETSSEPKSVFLSKKSISAYFVLFLLVTGVLAAVYLVLPGEDFHIRIDGSFDDWEDHISYAGYFSTPWEPVDDIRVEEYRLHVENGFLYGYVRTMEPMFACTDGVYTVQIFVDTGEWGGYNIGGIEAEYRLDIYGWDGMVQGTANYEFCEDRPCNDWNGYTHRGGLRTAHQDDELEFKIWLPVINGRDPMVVVRTGCCGRYHNTAGYVRPGEHSIVSTVTKVGPSVVEAGVEFDILEMSSVSISGGGELSSVTLGYDAYSGDFIESIALYDLEAQEYVVPWTPFYDGVELEPRICLKDGRGVLSVRAVVKEGTPAGSVVGIRVRDTMSTEGTAWLRPSNPDNVYVGHIPTEIEINGAFVHWNDRDVREDPLDDLYPLGAWNPNVDIRRYSVARGEITALMISVEGDLLGGADVPYIRGRPPELIDSDGDGIPDIHDPFPNDFTNDGTPDSEMLTPEGLPDVDGDGVADWPHGPDKWLNTTIPVHPDIPEEYWGREVSRYIGPMEKPVKTGEDMHRIYIDFDGDPSTGYTAPWLTIGAEYKITVSGRNMEVTHAELFEFTGTGWASLGGVPVALNDTSLEAGLDIELSDHATVAFISSDWQGNRDMALYKTSEDRTRSSTVDHRLYLRDDDLLLSTRGTEGGEVTLVNRDGQRDHTWSSHPLARDFQFAGTVAVKLYLEPEPRGDNKPGLNVTLYHEGGVIGTGVQPGIRNPGFYVITIDPGEAIIPEDNSLYMETVITGDPDTGSLAMLIGYDSQSNDSNMMIPTISTVEVHNICMWDEDGMERGEFYSDELVDVRANVTHPFDAGLISDAVMYVEYPDGTVMLQDIPMERSYLEGGVSPLISTWNSSFFVDENATGGRYVVRITATDSQGNSDTLSSFFICPVEVGVSVYPHGEQTVSDEAVYPIEVRNIGNVPDGYRLTPGRSSMGWRTELFHQGEPIAEDIHGDGVWDWIEPTWIFEDDLYISLDAMAYMEFQVLKYTAPGSQGQTDQTRIYASSVNHSQVSDHVQLITKTPYPMISRDLYLHQGDTMDLVTGEDDHEVLYIPEEGSNIWYLEPSLSGEFAIKGWSTVWLYMVPYISGHSTPDVLVELFQDGELLSYGASDHITEEGWYDFNILTETVLTEGSRLELKVSVRSENVDIYYDSQMYDSRVEIHTDTYIGVRNISSYRNGIPTDEFRAGDRVRLEAEVDSPMGSYDVVDAMVTVTSPDGTVFVEDMEIYEVTPSVKIFRHEFDLDNMAVAGIYEVKVEATDQDNNTVAGHHFISLPSGVLIEPDHHGTVEPGSAISYVHTVTNTGNGTDIFDITVSSSRGYNIILYSPGGIMMGLDIGGNGIWDYVNSAYDSNNNGLPDTGPLQSNSSINITVSLEIPQHAEDGDEITDITVTSQTFGHVRDSAQDITTIPEFPSAILLVLFVLVYIVLFPGKFKERPH